MLCGLRLVWRKFCSEILLPFLLRISMKKYKKANRPDSSVGAVKRGTHLFHYM